MELTTLKAQFAAEFIDIAEAAQVEGASWEPFQLQLLNNSDRLAIALKARQIAMSFTFALDAVVDSILEPGTPHVFVSINQDEASEKIRYARAIIDAIDEPVRPRLVSDSVTALEFKNGSRLISHPMRPVRGKAKARIYLDEMAHYPEGLDRRIYLAGLPATIKGGYMRIGSSPLGAKGLFWEMVTESLRKWPGFSRKVHPWWTLAALCKDPKLAKKIAVEMATDERVRAFGTPALIEIFENMFLEDFQQEYECAWIDEATAYITWEVIKANQKIFTDAQMVFWHARSVDEAMELISSIRQAVATSQIESVLSGGIDIGRKHDKSEMVIVGVSPTGRLPIRYMITLDKVPFEAQQDCFKRVIDELPIVKVLVDRNGIGMQLAEKLEGTGKAEGVDFTNPSKELWAVEARIRAEAGNTPLPPDRDLAYQIHSIKKTVTSMKNNVYDAPRNEKHHADMFWAWALAITAAKGSETDESFVMNYMRGRK